MKAKRNCIVEQVAAAIAADKDHSALCAAGASDVALGAAAGRYGAAMTALAALAAGSIRDLQAKGEALATCVTRARDDYARVDGDFGLAASIAEDLRYLGALCPRLDHPRGMSEAVVAQYVGLSVSTIRAARARGDFPEPVSLTVGRTVYYRETVDAWLDHKAGRAAPADLSGSEWMIRAEQLRDNRPAGRRSFR